MLICVILYVLHVCACTCLHRHSSASLQPCTGACVRVCKLAPVYAYQYTCCMSTFLHVDMRACCMFAFLHVCMLARMHVGMCACLHVCAPSHGHVRTCDYTCTCLHACLFACCMLASLHVYICSACACDMFVPLLACLFMYLRVAGAKGSMFYKLVNLYLVCPKACMRAHSCVGNNTPRLVLWHACTARLSSSSD